ncbi:hypothetical protein T4B_5848 [Trichinella pseudospiralis]|uniref:Uncharacterized protein n=1 Tax=Trichinella pseudospiralis TaxID=6337 RepID=A0A0V1HJT3_TRIPS|nr:hypothetical protein T4B_5848 [Trichinella pseudospiralis]
MIVVEWLNEKSVGRITLCVCAFAFKAWKVWKEWATFMRCRAYAVPCSIIIFHFCAECRKLSSGFDNMKIGLTVECGKTESE